MCQTIAYSSPMVGGWPTESFLHTMIALRDCLHQCGSFRRIDTSLFPEISPEQIDLSIIDESTHSQSSHIMVPFRGRSSHIIKLKNSPVTRLHSRLGQSLTYDTEGYKNSLDSRIPEGLTEIQRMVMRLALQLNTTRIQHWRHSDYMKELKGVPTNLLDYKKNYLA